MGSGYPAKTVLSLGTQKPIYCRCAHREQLVPALLAEVEMSMPLECFDKSGQKGHQPFGTDLVGRLPGEKQGVLDFWSKRWLSPTPRRLLHLLWMVEQPHRVATSVARGGSNLVKQCPFL